jgi:hypothetical protein
MGLYSMETVKEIIKTSNLQAKELNERLTVAFYCWLNSNETAKDVANMVNAEAKNSFAITEEDIILFSSPEKK